MIIKDFSPINSDTIYLNPNETDPKFFFSDNNSQLYAMITRYDGTSKFYILAYLRLEGYNNNYDYDYQIDFSNYIKLLKNDIVLQSHSTNVDYFVMPENKNFIVCMLNTTDVMSSTGFTQYISDLNNGEKYFTGANMSNASNASYYTFDFDVIDNNFSLAQTTAYSSELYNCSKFMLAFNSKLIGSGEIVVTGATTTTTTATPTTTTTTTAPPMILDFSINRYYTGTTYHNVSTDVYYTGVTVYYRIDLSQQVNANTTFEFLRTNSTNTGYATSYITVFNGTSAAETPVFHPWLSEDYYALAHITGDTHRYSIGADNTSVLIHNPNNVTTTTTTATPTTTTTTTTTTVDPYTYYEAATYGCSDCINLNSAIYIKSSSALTINDYYSTTTNYTNKYKIIQTVSSAIYNAALSKFNIDGIIYNHNADCNTAVCASAPTTTTTTTAAPVTTTTTTVADPYFYHFSRAYNCSTCADIGDGGVLRTSVDLTMYDFYVFSTDTSVKYYINGHANKAFYDSWAITHDFIAATNVHNSNCNSISCT